MHNRGKPRSDLGPVLVLNDLAAWLKFASLNRKAGRTRQAQRTLLRLLGYDPVQCAVGAAGYGAGSGRPDVMLAYVKHQAGGSLRTSTAPTLNQRTTRWPRRRQYV